MPGDKQRPPHRRPQVRATLVSSEDRLRGLNMSAVMRRMPALEAPMVPVGEVSPAEAASRLRSLLLEAERLAGERAELEAELKRVRDASDVSHRLASGVPEDVAFRDGMALFDRVVEGVQANATATKKARP